jgi:hypothetical protein
MTNRKTAAAGQPVRVNWDPVSRNVRIDLRNGAGMVLPVALIPFVPKTATDAELAAVAPSVSESGIRWELLDVEVYVPILALLVTGKDAWQRETARQLARIKSPARARAARENGKKGGRPRKHAAA